MIQRWIQRLREVRVAQRAGPLQRLVQPFRSLRVCILPTLSQKELQVQLRAANLKKTEKYNEASRTPTCKALFRSDSNSIAISHAHFSKSVNTKDAEFYFHTSYRRCRPRAINKDSTFTGDFTSRVMARTKVPPRVHQTLNELILLIALVPKVFMIPERIFTPHAMAAISNLVRDLPWPTSAREARYNATLFPLEHAINFW